ncbi:MAG: class I SAM-dependent methyltransferase [Bdellovibrionales bacterium]
MHRFEQISDYDQLYESFKADGFEGWGGETYELRTSSLVQVFDQFRPPPSNNSQGLDLGCGTGDLTQHIFKSGYDVIGCDFSLAALAWAREKHPDLHKLDLVNICEDFYCENQFDFIFDGNTLHCLTGEDRIQAFKNLRRWLKSDGILIVNHMLGDLKVEIPGRSYDKESRLHLRNGRPYRYSPENAVDLVRELGSFGFQLQENWVSSNRVWDEFHGFFR